MYIIFYIYICIHVDLSGKLYLSFQHLKCWHRRNKPWLIDTGGSGGCLKILTSIATRDLLKYVALDDWMMGKSTRKRNTFCLGAKTLFSGWLLQGFPSINLWNATSMLCNWLYIYIHIWMKYTDLNMTSLEEWFIRDHLQMVLFQAVSSQSITVSYFSHM